jgi:PAS domain S-box-containing protein
MMPSHASLDGTQPSSSLGDAATALAQTAQQPQPAASNTEEIIANMNDAVLVESDSGRVVLANEAFCRLFQLDRLPHELTGMEADGLTKQLNPAAVRLGKMRKRRRPSVGEEIRLTDGRVLELHYAPVARDGAAGLHLWQYRDITARKRFEAELHLSRQRLRNLAARDEARSSRLRSICPTASPSMWRS